jgi:hypothetical protein
MPYSSSRKMAKNITPPFEGLYYRIISWLGRWSGNQTFDDELGLDAAEVYIVYADNTK